MTPEELQLTLLTQIKDLLKEGAKVYNLDLKHKDGMEYFPTDITKEEQVIFARDSFFKYRTRVDKN